MPVAAVQAAALDHPRFGDDALLLAVHLLRIDDALKQAGIRAQMVILTCSLPMNANDTGLVLGHTTSGAEALAKKVPHARVVCAFNVVPREVLFGVYAARRKASRPSLVYCGDDARSKEVVFDPVDAGHLRLARNSELWGGSLTREREGPNWRTGSNGLRGEHHVGARGLGQVLRHRRLGGRRAYRTAVRGPHTHRSSCGFKPIPARV
jgi:predicted dinucleotide-binding enzyme